MEPFEVTINGKKIVFDDEMMNKYLMLLEWLDDKKRSASSRSISPEEKK